MPASSPLTLRLTPEIGAVVQRALEAAADRLYREAAETPAPNTLSEEVTSAQRRADALGRLAESALAADLDRGTAGDRYQVVLHVECDTLQRGDSGNADGTSDFTDSSAGPGDSGHAALEDAAGQRVSAETSRRLACDAAVVIMRHAADGTVLDVGRRTRTIAPAIWRALTARDKQCRFPGCAVRRCDVHHIEHWADGGATRLDNIALACRRHHRLLHEGG